MIHLMSKNLSCRYEVGPHLHSLSVCTLLG